VTRLRRELSTPQGKRRYVQRLFATIADRYDVITRVLSYGQDGRWKRRLVRLAAITTTDRVLDLACGTGDILDYACRRHPQRAVGLDLTHRMLARARRRDRLRDADLICGDMLALPFEAGAFDVVTTGYGLRNVPDLHLTFREILRVLVYGGRLLSLDFNRPTNPIVRGAYLAYLTVVGSIAGLVLHHDPDTYRYIPESIRNYPGAIGIARMLEAEGFGEVQTFPVLLGLLTIHRARKI
jgi:demethylmenaquinone methyltransferase/2-methoxy-6-polyprenyl-1,4-benzoquinol methylase